MLCAPVKITAGETIQHHAASFGPSPEECSSVSESQSHPSFSCFAASVLIKTQCFNGKAAADFDGRRASCPRSRLSTQPSLAVFSGQENMTGTSQLRRCFPSFEAPAVKRPDEKQEHYKQMVARIQHIFSRASLLGTD